MDALSKPDLSISEGTGYLLFAYDVARAIDLDQAERHVVAMKQREAWKHGRRAPKYFASQPPPLRITQDVTPMPIGDYHSATSVDLVLYDFGALQGRRSDNRLMSGDAIFVRRDSPLVGNSSSE